MILNLNQNVWRKVYRRSSRLCERRDGATDKEPNNILKDPESVAGVLRDKEVKNENKHFAKMDEVILITFTRCLKATRERSR